MNQTFTPTDDETYWACVGFRHDFGLLSDEEAQRVRAEGLSWLSAWRTGFATSPDDQGAAGIGKDRAEPSARTVDAACVSYDPGFRTRPFHEASKARAGGIKWLRAWRGVFLDREAPGPIERAIASVDAAAELVDDLLKMVDQPIPESPTERVWAILEIAAERARQISGEGWTTGGDDSYPAGQLAQAGACYGTVATLPLHMGALALACAKALCPACGTSMSLSVELDGSTGAGMAALESDFLSDPSPCPTPTLVAIAILERAVLSVLVDVGERRTETNFVGLRYLARETGIGAELVRAVVRQLRDNGLAVYHAGLWSEDGEPAGAGYAATAAAMKRAAKINRKASQ